MTGVDPATHEAAMDALQRDRDRAELESLHVGGALDEILLRVWERRWKQTRRGTDNSLEFDG